MRIFTPEQKLEIQKLYKEDKIKMRQIANLFSTNINRIGIIIKEDKNIRIRTAKDSDYVNYNLIHDYFSCIDSFEKAYLLGILFADGSVSNTSNRISLVSNDIDLLEFFRSEIKCSRGIRKNRLHKNAFIFDFSSIVMKNDLIKYGCVPSKALILEYPDFGNLIDEKFEMAFILGYFDGDGSLWISQNKNCAQFKIASSTKFCNALEKRLKILGFNAKTWHEDFSNQKPESSYLRICSRKEIVKFMKQMYNNYKGFFLKRKYEKFLELERIICAGI